MPILLGSVLDPDANTYSANQEIGYYIIGGHDIVVPFSEKPVSNRVFSFSKIVSEYGYHLQPCHGYDIM